MRQCGNMDGLRLTVSYAVLVGHSYGRRTMQIIVSQSQLVGAMQCVAPTQHLAQQCENYSLN